MTRKRVMVHFKDENSLVLLDLLRGFSLFRGLTVE